MASEPTFPLPTAASQPEDGRYREDLGPVDTALRLPLTSLLGWSALWLLVGGILAFLTSWKFHAPSVLADCSWFTYGRTYPAASNALLYGWGFNAAFAIAIWLLSRLAGAAPRARRFATVAVWFWNLGVLAAVGGLLAGETTGVEWMELPYFAALILLVCFGIIGSWAVTTLRDRRFREIFISQWYVVAAFFWFAWIFSSSELMLVYFPVRGTVQSIVGAWYTQGLFALWFGSIALAAIYYFLPKLSGRPVRYYSLSVLGFWTYGLFNGWLGVQRLAGAPVPAWVQSVGVAMSMLALVPLVIIGIGLLASVGGAMRSVKDSVVFKFLFFAVIAFVVSSLQLSLGAFRDPSHLTNITLIGQSQLFLTFFGFFSMAAFGAAYYILPRVARRPWSSAAMINIHFIATVLAVVIIYASLLIAGLRQADALQNVNADFANVVKSTSSVLLLRTAGYGLFVIGQLAFLVNVLLTMVRLPSRAGEEPLLAEPPAMEVVS